MALSWNELSPDKKYVYFIEGLASRRDPDTPVACCLCESFFLDSKSLINHFQTHFHQDGTSRSNLQVGGSTSLENGSNFLSQPTHFQNPPNVLGSYFVPTLVQNSVQWGGPTLTHRPQSYPSSQAMRSAISHGTFGTYLNQSSNIHPRFDPRPTGLPRFSAMASQSIPGVSGLTLGATSSHFMRTARAIEVEDPSTGCTKPYIAQLEQPIEQRVGGRNDMDGSGNPGKMDLTLKL